MFSTGLDRSSESLSAPDTSEPGIFVPGPVQAFAELAARTDHPVLLHGETGSGKTHLARYIHSLSSRSRRPFISINCAAIPEALFESEMFGHVRGAFTDAKDRQIGMFEAANRGTLLLDELGALPLSLQPKLLRVLDERTVRRLGSTSYVAADVRVIVATNEDLPRLVQEGRFREDLYYRCCVLDCRVPPLRERRDEIPALSNHLLSRSVRPGSEPPPITEGAIARLSSYRWPGNIRELTNILCQAAIYSEGRQIEPQHLPERIRDPRSAAEGGARDVGTRGHRYAAPHDPEREQQAILKALSAERGNRTRAARRLGMARSTLWAKLKQYRLG